jgi:hypothetical protein
MKEFMTVFFTYTVLWFRIFTRLFIILIVPFMVLLSIFAFSTGKATFSDLKAEFVPFFVFLWFFLVFFTLPVLIFTLYYYTDRKRLSLSIPRLNADFENERYVSSFSEVNENNQVIIPVFGNVAMDYWLKGDFKEKISTVEVKEVPNVKKVEYRKGRIIKEIPLDDMWQAVFSFKEKPQNGKLIVVYV